MPLPRLHLHRSRGLLAVIAAAAAAPVMGRRLLDYLGVDWLLTITRTEERWEHAPQQLEGEGETRNVDTATGPNRDQDQVSKHTGTRRQITIRFPKMTLKGTWNHPQDPNPTQTQTQNPIPGQKRNPDANSNSSQPFSPRNSPVCSASRRDS